jgi:predicted dehydrogenase
VAAKEICVSTAVAMAGTGDWARSGLGPALRAIAGVAIVACASPDLPQAHRFAADMGIPRVYPGLAEMLAGQPGLDLLVVSTPDDHHPAAIRCAAAAGVAVFCEKPLANSAADADLLAEAVEQAGIPATVGFSFRYSDAVQQLRRELQAGLLGTPWLLELHEHNPQFHPAIGRPLTWKGDPEHAAGGAIFEYGAHVVDLGCWLLGPASHVTADFATVVPGAVLDDIATLQLRYESGALGTLVTSWVLGGGFPGIRLRLHGSAGRADVRLGDDRDGTERYTRYAPSGEIVSDADLAPGRPGGPGHAAYVTRHLRDLLAVIGGAAAGYPDTMPTVRSAAHVQHVLDSALAATGRRLPVTGTGGTGGAQGRVSRRSWPAS